MADLAGKKLKDFYILRRLGRGAMAEVYLAQQISLGRQVAIPTLSGTIKLRIPPGTTNGKQLRVRGQGLPTSPAGERGDVYVVVRIQVPAEISDEERAVWEKLARLSRFNPRQTDA